jgi:hypothetical protein
MRKRVTTVAACCAFSLVPCTVAAQRLADMAPIGVVASHSGDHADAHVPQVRVWHLDSLADSPRRLWPAFALGGALIGGGIVVGVGLTQCDAGCNDDGGWAMAPPYVVAGAVIGGLIGGLVGLLVDDIRRNTGQSAVVAAP